MYWLTGWWWCCSCQGNKCQQQSSINHFYGHMKNALCSCFFLFTCLARPFAWACKAFLRAMMTDGIFGAATNEVKTANEEWGSELWNPTEGGGCEGTSHLRRQFTKEKKVCRAYNKEEGQRRRKERAERWAARRKENIVGSRKCQNKVGAMKTISVSIVQKELTFNVVNRHFLSVQWNQKSH